MSIIKICEICGKEFKVIPCRADTAKYCSPTCRQEALKGEKNCVCTQCGKKFHLKPYSITKYNRNHGYFCSKECYVEFKKIAFLGENNHQFGLKGELNSSFIRGILTHRNHKLIEKYIYCPERPDVEQNNRMKLHRYLVVTNYDKFHPCFFNKLGDYYVLKPGLYVHHIDGIHEHNCINNLTILSKSIHTKVHMQLKELAEEYVKKIIGVFKESELLENPEEDNQQPSLDSNIFKGSETNSRILTSDVEDSNADTSALLQKIQKFTEDYIVQSRKITDDGYNLTIKKILESEIKSSELNTNEL